MVPYELLAQPTNGVHIDGLKHQANIEETPDVVEEPWHEGETSFRTIAADEGQQTVEELTYALQRPGLSRTQRKVFPLRWIAPTHLETHHLPATSLPQAGEAFTPCVGGLPLPWRKFWPGASGRLKSLVGRIDVISQVHLDCERDSTVIDSKLLMSSCFTSRSP